MQAAVCVNASFCPLCSMFAVPKVYAFLLSVDAFAVVICKIDSCTLRWEVSRRRRLSALSTNGMHTYD